MELAWRASEADYFLRSRDSLAKLDPASSSWKTFLPFGPVGPTLSPDDWPAFGMTVAGECFPLLTWERRTLENAGSSLPSGMIPTATATDSKSSRNSTVKNRKVAGHSGHTLTDFVTLFPTPTAADYGSRNNGQRGDGSSFKTAGAPSLSTMAKHGLWPTPRASPNENRQTNPTPSQIAGKHGMNLATAVNMWPTPRASDGEKGGPNQRGSKGDLALPAAVVQWATPTASNKIRSEEFRDGRTLSPAEEAGGSRKLNPEFVTWLMGYPRAWTLLNRDLFPQKKAK